MTKSNAETPRDAAGEILADMLAVASGDAAAVDETVVVNQPASEDGGRQPAGERVGD